jgi:hypothetical protein
VEGEGCRCEWTGKLGERGEVGKEGEVGERSLVMLDWTLLRRLLTERLAWLKVIEGDLWGFFWGELEPPEWGDDERKLSAVGLVVGAGEEDKLASVLLP